MGSAGLAHGAHFRVGFAKQNITPTKATPMWGYGARHATLSTGVRDPLYAKAIVIDTGATKLAIVGLDLGRGPRDDMMHRIRQEIKKEAGIEFVLISGSHTHHGPVIELIDEPGGGHGTYDDAVAYAAELEQKLIRTILTAANNVQDATIGWNAKSIELNRNRHSKFDPKPVDPELGVIRFDSSDGEPLAMVVNFAAHPTTLPAEDLRFSADWPGQMMNAVEAQLATPCVFIQGAAGDLSTRQSDGSRGHKAFGEAVARQVVDVWQQITPQPPKRPSIAGRDNEFTFDARLPVGNPVVKLVLGRAFFPELAHAVVRDDVAKNKIKANLATVLINGELALVGASGEFFCEHANRLKQRSRAAETFFFGYCNGHNMYFPTIEAAAEGGYGADPTVSWVSLGAGEQMMNRALINIYEMSGAFRFELPLGNAFKATD